MKIIYILLQRPSDLHSTLKNVQFCFLVALLVNNATPLYFTTYYIHTVFVSRTYYNQNGVSLKSESKQLEF